MEGSGGWSQGSAAAGLGAWRDCDGRRLSSSAFERGATVGDSGVEEVSW